LSISCQSCDDPFYVVVGPLGEELSLKTNHCCGQVASENLTCEGGAGVQEFLRFGCAFMVHHSQVGRLERAPIEGSHNWGLHKHVRHGVLELPQYVVALLDVLVSDTEAVHQVIKVPVDCLAVA